MDQSKISSFLKELRKEKGLTQENLAEQLNVSSKSISRWETGRNMPDISMLVEIAEYFNVSIPEIIDGERKSEDMNQETRHTVVKMAEYSKNEARGGKQRILGYLMAVFGIFIIISALTVFPNESSWGSIYSFLGSVILTTGIYFIEKSLSATRSRRILSVAVSIALLFGLFTASDYIAVTFFNQVPRFKYQTVYDSRNPDQLTHKTLFYTVIQKNPGTKYEEVEIVNRRRVGDD